MENDSEWEESEEFVQKERFVDQSFPKNAMTTPSDVSEVRWLRVSDIKPKSYQALVFSGGISHEDVT